MIESLLLTVALSLAGHETPVQVVYHATYESVTMEYQQHNFTVYGDTRRIGGFVQLRGATCVVHVSLEAPDVERCEAHERQHCPPIVGMPPVKWHGNELVRDC